VRFPLGDWIDDHAGCRYNLGLSGMQGAIPAFPWPRRRPPPTAADELRLELADRVGVDPRRIYLFPGATEANAAVLGYLARRSGRSRPVARVRYPEYPPLVDAGRWAGFQVRTGAGRADVAVVSRPRNPEGDLWSDPELTTWASGATHLLVDETFREFAGAPSVARRAEPRVWATGTFTKFFGADDARVGFALAPPEEAERFGRFHGVVADELAPASAAIALDLLRRVDEVRRAVEAVLRPNAAAFARAFPGAPRPAAPLFFDRTAPEGGGKLADRCLRASVLVCPGALFGDPAGVRIALTRRNAPAALRAYLRVRDRA
jgi:histidinol-phosphate/aromatic aminotransferase/cobyric acid decarboxylase-like protein